MSDTSKAQVTVTLLVDVDLTYGDDWKYGDIKKKTKENAVRWVQKEIEGNKNMAIVGSPKVTLYIAGEH